MVKQHNLDILLVDGVWAYPRLRRFKLDVVCDLLHELRVHCWYIAKWGWLFLRSKKHLRPLQFNYLSYKLFLEKKILSDSKKKEKKKSTLVSYGRKWFWNFLSDSPPPPKKVQVLRMFIARVIQSTTGSYQCCSRALNLRLQGLIDWLILCSWE